MTIRIVFKALLVIWPFLRDAIFKDRTVSEVIRENWHINVMFVLIVSLVLFMFYTTTAALEARDKMAKLEALIEAQPVCLSPQAVEERKRRLMDLLK